MRKKTPPRPVPPPADSPSRPPSPARCYAFCVGTAGGVVMAKIMNLFSKEKINPLIGSAGVSAVLYTLCR